MEELPSLFSLILKKGLRKNKFKNSKLQFFDERRNLLDSQEKKGAIFCYRSKKTMTKGIGVVVTSEEAVLENTDQFSHFTPNVFRYGTYADDKKSFTKGHEEKNLRQINTFIVDVDLKRDSDNVTYNDLLLASLDMGFMPTLVLKSDQGFQAFYCLEEPVFVSNKGDFKAIRIAKIISQNLRECLAEKLPVDKGCNHFGITRIPRTDNVLFFEESYTYSFQEWLVWSMKQSEDKKQESSVEKRRKNFSVIYGGSEGRQIDEPWFQKLLNVTDIRGEQGQRGRNNVAFTLALACYSSGLTLEATEMNLLQFNENLEEPLKEAELQKALNSAFSGKYKGASREFIRILCETWLPVSFSDKELFIRQAWHKYKKPRSERERSHMHEWIEDVLRYIENSSPSEEQKGFLKTTKKKIQEELSIPARSLDKVINQLCKKGMIVCKRKRGRNGGIKIATTKALMIRLIKAKKEQKMALFNEMVYQYDVTRPNVRQKLLAVTAREQLAAYQMALFELESG